MSSSLPENPSAFTLLGHLVTRRGACTLAAGALALGCTAGAGIRPVSAGAAESAAGDAPTPAFAGGTGMPDDPYQIATAEQLAAVRDNLAASYVLTADVDLSDQGTWEPVGHFVYGEDVNMETGEMNMDAAFSGIFDGGGHTISGLTSTAGTDGMDAGLFGLVTGTVENLTLIGARVVGSSASKVAGGVVGYSLGATVQDVTVRDSTIQGTNCVGGVVGGNDVGGVVSNCATEGVTIIVTGSNDFSDGRLIQADVAECGGLVVGGSFAAAVNDCTARGTVVSVGNEPVGLGGLAGCLELATSVSGNAVDATIVTSNAHAVGGLAGYAGNGDDGTGTIGDPTVITNCDVTTRIYADGATHVGGLVGTGLYFYGMEGRFAISDCAVRGIIEGAVTPGSVAGRATDSSIEVESCEIDVLIDGELATDEIGQTDRLYESADQYE